jgi:hypothetical protein
MNVVIDDIKQRTTVPGLIDVQKFFTWDEIEGYFEANNTQNQYTVVVVDYLYKLNVECNSKYPGDIPKAKDAVISRAISWCHKKATFALISPHQVNREGHKGAKKDGSTGYDLDSLYQSSAVQQDADLVISVFSSDSARAVNSMTAKCLKHRGTEMFATHELKLDGRTKYVRDADEVKDETITKGKAEVARIWARQQAKQKAEAEARGETWTPTPIGGATETPITMPDTEVM